VSSLRTRLLVWLLSGVLLVGIVGGWSLYSNALAEADTFFDYQLRQTALVLLDQPVEYLLTQPIPGSDAYDFVVRVWSLDGVAVYSSPLHRMLPDITTFGFSTATTSEGRWRVYGAQSLTKVIQVAQPMRVRERQAADLALRALEPFALLLPVLVILIWIAVSHALEPLQQLTAQVKARRVNALEPLPDGGLPEEVRPLMGALNDLLGRLGTARDRERAFMADAAHELRTPLTALHLQMGMLARAGNEAERAEAMEKLSAGVQRAIRLVEQMLSLARQEPRTEAPRVTVNLEDIAREVVTETIPLADAKRIDLGISRSEPAQVLADPEALRTLLRNLVDNAVRYTGTGGQVDVGVESGPEGALLKVSDNGPGIPLQDRARIFDRFYRRPGTSPPGSGLGMAIVKAIADTHGAVITLEANPSQTVSPSPGSTPGSQGLVVEVRFPPESFFRKSAAASR
jgi:two-component system, OmpR family, sensor kinase